jgi:uncharacterized protein
MKIFFKIVLFLFFLVAFGLIFYTLADILLSPISKLENQGKVCFDKNCFNVEIAKTADEISSGLSFRKKLDKNSGMFFVFEEENIYPFWMKNTLIPLDIIWINKENKVVFIKKTAEPCLPTRLNLNPDCEIINPIEKSKFVLEINAGISERLGLRVGDIAILTY